MEVGKFAVEGEIEQLKRDKNVLMMELVRLRQQQQSTEQDLQGIRNRLQSTEQRQQQMMTFLAKAMQSPSFLSQLMQQTENKKQIGDTRKKRRFPKKGGAQELAQPESHKQLLVKYEPMAASDSLSSKALQPFTSEGGLKASNPVEAFFHDAFFPSQPQGSYAAHQARATLTDFSDLQAVPDLSKELSDSIVPSVANQMGFDLDLLDLGVKEEQDSQHNEHSQVPETISNDPFWEQFLGSSDDIPDTETDFDIGNPVWNGKYYLDQLVQHMGQLDSVLKP